MTRGESAQHHTLAPPPPKKNPTLFSKGKQTNTPYLFQIFVSASCVCAACRCYTGFRPLYWVGKGVERPWDSSTEARRFYGIFLAPRYVPLYPLAAEEKTRVRSSRLCRGGWGSTAGGRRGETHRSNNSLRLYSPYQSYHWFCRINEAKGSFCIELTLKPLSHVVLNKGK